MDSPMSQVALAVAGHTVHLVQEKLDQDLLPEWAPTEHYGELWPFPGLSASPFRTNLSHKSSRTMHHTAQH